MLDASTGSYVQAEVLTGLRGNVVSWSLMSNDCMTVPGDMPLQRFADKYVLKTGRRCYAVEDETRSSD